MSTTKQQLAGVRRSKRYKALKEDERLNLSDAAVLAILGHEVPAEAEAAPAPMSQAEKDVARLVKTGAYTQEEAEAVVQLLADGAAGVSPASPEPTVERPMEPEPEPEPVVAEPTPEQPAYEALITEHGLKFTRGRVYVSPDASEAIVRVRKTGSPEIVQSAGVGHTAAVVVFRTESGAVAMQNLMKAS